jgi:hypothetical protein
MHVVADALMMKVREGGRIVAAAVLVTIGFNTGGHSEVLGVEITSAEVGAGWLRLLRGLASQGVVALVTSDTSRAGSGDCRLPPRSGLATLPLALRRQPDVGDHQEQLGVGHGAVAQRL